MAMPTYEYACTTCGNRFEIFQRFAEDSLTICDVCGGTLRKVFHPAGIVLKGSGFYRTDSRKAGVGAGGSDGSGSGSRAGTGSDGSDTSSSKGTSSGSDSGSDSGSGSKGSSSSGSGSKAPSGASGGS
jgi:putative FmdB family regulatory protein